MLKKMIVLGGMLFVAFVFLHPTQSQPKQGRRITAPSAPAPQGFCWPPGSSC